MNINKLKHFPSKSENVGKGKQVSYLEPDILTPTQHQLV